MYPREWIALKAFAIDSQAEGNLLRFVNHADTPNLESLSVYHDGLFHIIFRATREIKVGEELNYDYGGIYWNHRRKVSSIQLEKIK
ncbi:MAG: hypothetical protein S4CHLAM45_13200 [Chlamydiales bacterium]|nr:hypothetical protein [Chlamydiales bacterium]MCH9619809.1 hypothetical protein [Chlamydiales bacterium]MCH9623415.1 hypothetical protein [Chlamydiales bacterium]